MSSNFVGRTNNFNELLVAQLNAGDVGASAQA